MMENVFKLCEIYLQKKTKTIFLDPKCSLDICPILLDAKLVFKKIDEINDPLIMTSLIVRAITLIFTSNSSKSFKIHMLGP